jgi:hypothetical protein
MTKIHSITIALFLCSFSLFAQNQETTTEDYWKYHELICKAEMAFFLDYNEDSCLYYYSLAFKTFSFNYVHDLINAAQIACYSKKDFKKYIYKGLRFGLKASHLNYVPLLKSTNIVSEIENYEKTSDYLAIRQKYLSKINFDYLSWIYDLGIEDQIEKKKNNYAVYTLNYINSLISKIKQYGFPSNKTIGIESRTIFAEAKRKETDLHKRIVAFPELDYFKTDDNILSNHFIMVLLHHRGCSYTELKNILLDEIAKGNLHPREFGFIYDRQCQYELQSKNRTNENCPKLATENGVFRIGNEFISNSIDKIECSQNKVNALRAKYNIVPLEVDKMKRVYEKQYGFKLFWGFWDIL